VRRWNGWGEEATSYHFPDSAADYLAERVGIGERIPDATLETVLAAVPAPRLLVHPLVSSEPYERLLHARGQSLPDWVALRHGRIPAFPDGVAYPQDEREVRQLLDYARESGAHLIPYGGGTSVVGHINPLEAGRPVLTVSLSRLDELLELDETSRLATFGAGANGPQIERLLAARGCTLGHYPQSFELSTLGGWIATRSSGQQSYYYGRIEDLFAGGRVETLVGTWELPALPASAAGPDLRQVILGSEGRLGIITRATVRVRPLPEVECFLAVFFPDWERGMHAMREIAQERLPISMARLSDAQETETTLALSGKEKLVAWADRGLRLLGHGDQRCLLIYGLTGGQAATRLAARQVRQIARGHHGLYTGSIIGKLWRKTRFLTPYLRNTLWERGYALDTLETAVPWAQVPAMAAALKSAILRGLEPTGERVLVFAHLSHIYSDGASIYVTYLYRRSADPDETLERWLGMKTAASQALVAHGGTISHQHGVGRDHAPYLEAEKGAPGMALLRSAAETLDPDGILNPGVLVW
jgi:alkyldihydroxyacetonephosphate synthase